MRSTSPQALRRLRGWGTHRRHIYASLLKSLIKENHKQTAGSRVTACPYEWRWFLTVTKPVLLCCHNMLPAGIWLSLLHLHRLGGCEQRNQLFLCHNFYQFCAQWCAAEQRVSAPLMCVCAQGGRVLDSVSGEICQKHSGSGVQSSQTKGVYPMDEDTFCGNYLQKLNSLYPLHTHTHIYTHILHNALNSLIFTLISRQCLRVTPRAARAFSPSSLTL